MNEKHEYKVCPECGSKMTIVSETDGKILYKCRNFDCGILILTDKNTGKELQRWSRNG